MALGVCFLFVALASQTVLAEERQCGAQGCESGGMGLIQKRSFVARDHVNEHRDDEDGGEAMHSSTAWLNGNDQDLNFNCPSGALTRMMSTHHNGAEDRRWNFECGSTGTGMSKLSQTNWVNDWDGTLDYTCPANSAVTGLFSVHDNHKEDRRWKITCSQASGGQISSGGFSGWINGWDNDMNHACAGGSVVTGLYSVHDNGKEDRRWKVKCGTVVVDTPAPTAAPVPATPAPTQCVDDNGDATDVYDYDCSAYSHCLAGGDPSYTEDYDDEDFTASKMCCSCKFAEMSKADGRE